MEVMNSEVRSHIMSKIRKKNTKPEIIVRKFLFKKGFRFRIHVRELIGSPDIVLPKHKTIIFVNGCFWHAHEGCKHNKTPKTRKEYWIPKIIRNVERDKRNKQELKKLGWKVITVWECQLGKSILEKTLYRLTKILEY